MGHDDYDETIVLGEGTFGVVTLAVQKSTGRKVAIKRFKSKNYEEGVNFTAVREFKILSEIRHENIVELLECFVDPGDSGRICMVLEFASTDLKIVLANHTTVISMADVKSLVFSLLRAVEACHKMWVLHRDLKPDNVLFVDDGTLKLADFGLARTYGTPKRRLSPEAVTLWYKPPELLLGSSEYSASVDMWGVGCILAELLLRRPFLQGNQTDISQLDTIFRVFGTPNETNWPDHGALPLPMAGLMWDDCAPIPFDEIFTAAPPDVLSLLRSMLVLDPVKRFTATQCLGHPYFSNAPLATPKERLPLKAAGS